MSPTSRDQPPVVLLIDDEVLFLKALRRQLKGQGYVVHGAQSGPDGLEIVQREHVDVAVVDLDMPPMNGLDTIREIKRLAPGVECVLLTGRGTLEAAEDAFKVGASDYFEKPILDQQRFYQILRKCLEVRDLRARTDRLAAELQERDQFEKLIGNSRPMQRLKARIKDYGPHDHLTVLIQGESGTGKERVARALHVASRRTGPFLAINCAAIPANLLESELFGHERSAFTGADRRRIGMFEKATSGTLFLDEIGDMPQEMQAKLLRVLQQREVTRVGGTEPIKINTRVVSATHRDLRAMVEEGTFRNDLWFRLNGLELHIPPLRDRDGDVRLLAYHFARAYAQQAGMTVRSIDHEAVAALQARDWADNNVRELETAIQRAMVHMPAGEEVLKLEHLQLRGAAGRAARPGREEASTALPEGFDPEWFELDYGEARKSASDWFRRVYVIERLKKTGYNITRAAEMSGVARANFRKMMKASGVEKPKNLEGKKRDDG